MNNKKIYTVIHHRDELHTLDQARISFECGVDGIFLISHDGRNDEILKLIPTLKKQYPRKQIGINFLGWDLIKTIRSSNNLIHSLDILWLDDVGIGSTKWDYKTTLLTSNSRIYPEIKIFGSIAFKYQEEDTDPQFSVKLAEHFNFTPITSGSATGFAPTLDKIKKMSEISKRGLGIASGLNIENIESFLPYTKHILVSTGISLDFHTIDIEKLLIFVSKVRAYTADFTD